MTLHDLVLAFPAAVVHYASSVACEQSQRGIATVVQPKRPADIDERGPGAAGVWVGQPKPPEAHQRAPAASAWPGEVPGHKSYMIYRYFS